MGYVIAARKSDLARLQALHVGAAFKKKFPSERLEFHFRESLGDKNLSDPLWKMPEKGVFTEDFRQGLLSGEFDMVVHSWKDLPVEAPRGTQIVATLPREDVRDLFLLKKEHWEKVQKSGRLRVYTSSPRRMYNLESFFKNYLPTSIEKVKFKSVRGNIPTRISKMFSDLEVDGLVLAKAAWDRLFLSNEPEFADTRAALASALRKCRWMVLPLRVNPCAAAQGALAVEIKDDRNELAEKLREINCASTFACVQEERATLRSYGGGCHQKIGVTVLDRPYGKLKFLRGETDGDEKLRSEELLPFPEVSFSAEESFPLKASQGQWYRRENLEFNAPSGVHHFIARANALPLRQAFEEDAVLWVSGNKSWKKLASRGLWINGSTEGLGESEEFRLEALAGDKPWVKWTHSQGHDTGRFIPVATYELRPKRDLPNLRHKKNFFWHSGSSFLAAVENQPEILAAHHFCGPGNTYQIISEYMKGKNNSGKVFMALDFKHWARNTWKGDEV